MQQDAGLKLRLLKVDGGAAANDFLMQFQADILDVPVERPKPLETTALGAAYLAGLAAGFGQARRMLPPTGCWTAGLNPGWPPLKGTSCAAAGARRWSGPGPGRNSRHENTPGR